MSIKAMNIESWIPWIICVSFIILFMVVGLRAGRDTDRASDDFLTGGANFKAPTVVLSLFATGNTGFMFSAAVGAGYLQGVSALWIVPGWFMGEVVFFQFFPHRINKLAHARKSVSIPDYISASVPESGRRAVQIVCGAVIMFAIAPYLIGQSIAAGKALSASTDMTSRIGVLIGGGTAMAIATFYCVRGGLRSSIRANAIQGAVILALVAILFVIVLEILGGPQAAIDKIRAVRPDAFDPFAINPAVVVAVSILGAAVAGFGGMMGLPTNLMRLAVAKDQREVRRAKWWYLIVTYCFWAVMIILGLLMIAAVPDVKDPEQALFAFARGQSPVLLGVVLAGISALILSTVDGSLMVGGSALSDDIADARHAPDRRRGAYRMLGLLLFAVAVLIAAISLSTSSVFTIILFGVSAMAGGIGPAFLISTLGIRTATLPLCATVLTGAGTAILWSAAGMAAYASEALPAFICGFAVHAILMRRQRTIESPSA